MSIKLPAQTAIDFQSEVCIVPIEMDLNTLFLNSKNTSASPTLDNCVTCVGCITSAEEIFVKESNAEMLKLLQQQGTKLQFVFSKSAQLMIDIHSIRNQYPDYTFEVEDLQQVASYHSQLQEGKKIITHCPAVRLYILKKKPELYKYVNTVGSMLEFQDDTKIYISACHDRKIEAMKKQSKCFTIKEFIEVFNSQQGQLDQGFNFFQIQDILSDQFGPYTQKQGINTDQVIYEYQNIKLIHNTNYRNLENLIRKSEQIKTTNDIYLVEACPRGCFGGAQSGVTKTQCQQISNNVIEGQNTQQLQKNAITCFDKIEEAMQDKVQGVKIGDLQW
ncbi:putative Fe-S cluster assembly factor NAR1 [Spironucleus salmonicida]|uniref:Fe-S cluster assembly factor NAR1 n=1 Tax=Spironucleus salmonicida TaxID=348837 RepID=V6M7M0_9EUKA|nr:putative Fe-S cluster assembly factor NAR1 [Spironucleus salmonicida]|eukprot:EST49464.1 Putative Fe-S cluster assembly factor NAR1 [Spironucleus salmonicida]